MIRQTMIRRFRITLAWYPLRGRRCNLVFADNARSRLLGLPVGWYVGVGVGPAFFGIGTGVPSP